MKSRISLRQRGDTLVEVMLSTAVLSLVLAGAFTITNKATRINQSANERTTVSNLLQREAELIRASIQQDSATFWNGLNFESSENGSFCDLTTGPKPSQGAFYMKDSLSKAEIKLSGDGKIQDYNEIDFFDVWVEPVGSKQAKQADFFIYACWDAIGSEGTQRSGLVLRLSK